MSDASPLAARSCAKCGATPVPGGGPEGGATIHQQGCPAGGPDVLTRTVALIEQAGYTPDAELWVGPDRSLVTVAANCSHTPVPGGCGPINPGNCATHGGG